MRLCAQQHLSSPQERPSMSLRDWPTLEELRPSSLANGPPPMASACGMHGVPLLRGIHASISAQVVVDTRVACSGRVGTSGDAVTSYRCSCMLVGSASVCACVLNSTCRRFKSQDHSSTSLRGWPMLEGVRPSALANGLPMASACVTVACTVCRTCGHICASIVARVVATGRCTCGVFRSRGCKR
jgi:hypothetical protein